MTLWRVVCLLEAAHAVLKNDCTPNPLFEIGVACNYGVQCQSKFCCPYAKICMVDSMTSVSSTILREKNSAEHFEIMKLNICQPAATTTTCMGYDDGTVEASDWDPSQCNCVEGFLDMYNANRWAVCDSASGSPTPTPTPTPTPAPAGPAEWVIVSFKLDKVLSTAQMASTANTIATSLGVEPADTTMKLFTRRRLSSSLVTAYVLEFRGLTEQVKNTVTEKANQSTTFGETIVAAVLTATSLSVTVSDVLVTRRSTTNTSNASDDGGISTGAVIGIAVASLVVAGAFIFAAKKYLEKNRVTHVAPA